MDPRSPACSQQPWRCHQLNRRGASTSLIAPTTRSRPKLRATAKFAAYADAEVTYRSADKTYTVTTYVDSQNGFGAMLRTRYVCTVTVTNPGETWKVIDLDVKE